MSTQTKKINEWISMKIYDKRLIFRKGIYQRINQFIHSMKKNKQS